MGETATGSGTAQPAAATSNSDAVTASGTASTVDAGAEASKSSGTSKSEKSDAEASKLAIAKQAAERETQTAKEEKGGRAAGAGGVYANAAEEHGTQPYLVPSRKLRKNPGLFSDSRIFIDPSQLSRQDEEEAENGEGVVDEEKEILAEIEEDRLEVEQAEGVEQTEGVEQAQAADKPNTKVAAFIFSEKKRKEKRQRGD